MVRRRWDEIADNIRRFARGETLINVVTTDLRQRIRHQAGRGGGEGGAGRHEEGIAT